MFSSKKSNSFLGAGSTGSKTNHSFHGLHVTPVRIVLLIGFAGILILCAATAWFIWQLRSRELQDAKRELITLDIVLVEDTERALQSADLVLRSLVDTVAGSAPTSDAYRRLMSDQETYALLRSRVAGIPYIESVALVDADGHIINDSARYPPPSVNVSGKDYFIEQREGIKDTPFLGASAQSQTADKRIIYLARRLETADGGFLGLVLCTIDAGYFENLYKALQIGNGAAVSLWRKDGTLLARYPLPPVSNFKSAGFEGRHRSEAPQTFEYDRSVLDGQSRLIATVAGKQFPIVVDVGQATDTILSDWRHISTLAISGAMLCVTAIIVIVWLLARQFRAFEALRVAVAERDSAEAARIEAEAQLRQAQKLEAVGELTGGIAHDFNNLLTAVMGNLDLLSRHSEGADPRLHRWAKSALEAAKRGATLTQRLLAFSRRQPLDPKSTDIAQLLNSMSELLGRTLGESIEIETRLSANLWLAFVDLNQLDSAILNIAINARDAMDGRGHLAIEAHNVTIDKPAAPARLDIAPGDYVLISLHDTGRGISKDVLERVYEPFFTTKPIGQGTGLGLSQVYGFLKQTGGQIDIESASGQGTTVKMYLPRAPAEMDVLHAGPVEGGTHQERSLSGAAVVLVVEDEEDVRAYTVEILTGLGHSVHQAGDAAQALDILGKDPTIDLLLTDIGLPGMNGAELARQAYKLRPRLKTLFASGYARQALMHDDRLDEGVQLLAKPFSREELAQKVQYVLAQTRERAAS